MYVQLLQASDKQKNNKDTIDELEGKTQNNKEKSPMLNPNTKDNTN